MPADSPLRRPARRRDRPSGTRPLRRKPKRLDAEPALFQPSATGPGGPAPDAGGARRRDPAAGPGPAGRAGTGFTDERGELLPALPALPGDRRPDPEVVRRAQRIAARLAVPRPRRDPTARRGIGELAPVRYRGGSDDIDLDATVEALAEHPVPQDDDIVVRERVRTRRSVVLAVDVSGSMRGERVRTAAATVGALAGELARDDLAVLAFWSDAALLVRLGERVTPFRLLETLLRIPARGLTNVSFPLQVARRQLARVPARDARVLLLSDCVHNAGPDPRFAASGLPRLDVLLDTSGEHDTELGRDLARLGRGRLATVHRFRDVAPAVGRLFAG